MASKTNNVTLPDGTTVALPAWASESTMDQVVNYMSAANKVDQKFLGLMKGLGADIGGLQSSIAKLAVGVKTNDDSTEAANAGLDNAKGVTKAAKSLLRASKFFGDSEKPLTSMVDAAGGLMKSFDGISPSFVKKMLPVGSGLAGHADAIAGGMDVVVDAALAYAGWNAAKFEQFAEAQKQAIDAGAIFYSSAEQFDLLYKNSTNAGVTYKAMLDTVGNFGGTMTALGGSVSAGTVNFVDMFGNLNKMADGFGDLGLSSKDMMAQYAEYIEFSRLSGSLDNATADSGKDLNNSFINLQVESSALANLTSLSKTDAMRRQLQAASAPMAVLAMAKLEETGQFGVKEVAKGINAALGLIAPENEKYASLLALFQTNLAQSAANIGNFDISRGIDTADRAALETGSPGFIRDINSMVQAGTASSEEANKMILTSLANYGILAGKRLDVNAGAQAGSAIKATLEYQSAAIMLSKNMGNWINLSIEEQEALTKATAKALKDSGNSVVAMNDAQTLMLGIQETMTLPMGQLSAGFSNLADAFNEGKDKINAFFGTGDAGFGTSPRTDDVPEGSANPPPVLGSTADSGRTVTDSTGSTDTTGNDTTGTTGTFDGAGAFTTTTPPKNVPDNGDSFNVNPNDPANFETSPKPATVTPPLSETSTVEDVKNFDRSLTGGNGSVAKVGLSDEEKAAEAAEALTPDEINIVETTAVAADKTVSILGTKYTKEQLIQAKEDGTVKRSIATRFLEKLNLAEKSATKRKHGGPVNPGQPYIVGDQLGMANAEMFVPDSAGQIVSNTNLNSMIGNLSNNNNNDLTKSSNSSIISSLQQEYDAVIQSKIQAIATMRSLSEAIKTFNSTTNRKAKIDLLNSA